MALESLEGVTGSVRLDTLLLVGVDLVGEVRRSGDLNGAVNRGFNLGRLLGGSPPDELIVFDAAGDLALLKSLMFVGVLDHSI